MQRVVVFSPLDESAREAGEHIESTCNEVGPLCGLCNIAVFALWLSGYMFVTAISWGLFIGCAGAVSLETFAQIHDFFRPNGTSLRVWI